MTAESMREDPRVVTALFAGRSGCGRDRIMGHADRRILRRYQDVVPELMRDEADRLDALFGD